MKATGWVIGTLAAGMLGAVLTPAVALAQGFDGITIIAFKDAGGASAIAPGDHIVVFVTARGSFAAVTDGSGKPGCVSSAVPGSYTGRSIAFGVEGTVAERAHRLDRLCPIFTLHDEGADMVRVRAGSSYSQRHEVVARVPFRAIDFGAAHFARHNVRGVRIGPVEDRELGPLRGSDFQDHVRNFARQVGKPGESGARVQGYAAPAAVTGWPWDVLYYARFHQEFETKVASDGFREAVRRTYGEPSSEHPDSGYMAWLYDLDGKLATSSERGENLCLRTAEFWAAYDARGFITSTGWQANSTDLGPWGCSLMMEITPNRSDGGVVGYALTLGSGYVRAINHFFQRLEDPRKTREKLDQSRSVAPTVR